MLSLFSKKRKTFPDACRLFASWSGKNFQLKRAEISKFRMYLQALPAAQQHRRNAVGDDCTRQPAQRLHLRDLQLPLFKFAARNIRWHNTVQ